MSCDGAGPREEPGEQLLPRTRTYGLGAPREFGPTAQSLAMLESVADTRRTVFVVRELPTPVQLAETAEAVGVVVSVQSTPPQLAGSQCPSACKACKLPGQLDAVL